MRFLVILGLFDHHRQINQPNQTSSCTAAENSVVTCKRNILTYSKYYCMLVTQPYSKFTYAQKEWCTDSGANTGAQIVNTVNNRQSERSETLNFNNLNTNSLET